MNKDNLILFEFCPSIDEIKDANTLSKLSITELSVLGMAFAAIMLMNIDHKLDAIQ